MDETRAGRITVWELLAVRDYKRLLGAQFTGQAADGVAQGVIATELVLDPLTQGTPGRILALFAVTLLPYSVLSPFLGVFVDRWDRRRLLIGTNFARALLLFSLPLWEGAAPGDLGLMIGVLGILGLGRLFHTTKAAVLPVVLHEHDLVRGNTLSSVGGTLSVLAGGVVGLWLGGELNLEVALVGVGVVYVVAALIARLIHSDLAHERTDAPPVLEAARRVIAEMSEGIRAVSKRRPAAAALGSIFSMRTITILVAIGVILTIKAEFSGERVSGGLALGGAGAGAFLAALCAPMLGDRYSKPKLIVAGFIIAGLGIVGLGGISSLPAVVGLMVALGFGGFVSKVAADSQIQESLPDEYRGRAFSFYDLLYNMASIVAGSIVVLFESADLRILLLVTGAATILMGLAVGASLRETPPT